MAEQTPSRTGTFFGLIVLIISLIIASASLYILMANLNVKGTDPMALGLFTVVAFLILLIIYMMWSIGSNARTERDDEIE